MAFSGIFHGHRKAYPSFLIFVFLSNYARFKNSVLMKFKTFSFFPEQYHLKSVSVLMTNSQ